MSHDSISDEIIRTIVNKERPKLKVKITELKKIELGRPKKTMSSNGMNTLKDQ